MELEELDEIVARFDRWDEPYTDKVETDDLGSYYVRGWPLNGAWNPRVGLLLELTPSLGIARFMGRQGHVCLETHYPLEDREVYQRLHDLTIGTDIEVDGRTYQLRGFGDPPLHHNLLTDLGLQLQRIVYQEAQYLACWGKVADDDNPKDEEIQQLLLATFSVPLYTPGPVTMSLEDLWVDSPEIADQFVTRVRKARDLYALVNRAINPLV